MKIHELKYSNTNTYLIEGDRGIILFDTGWAGTLPGFYRSMGELNIPVREIDYILISHFHPDHMGIAQDIASSGAVIVVADVQKDHIHAPDPVFAKDRHILFRPIEEDKVRFVPIAESRSFLQETGLKGELLYTPGHSDDSISLWLDEGVLFVGDLNPLYELEMHKGTKIAESWNRLLQLHPEKVYYGHAKTAELKNEKIMSPAGSRMEERNMVSDNRDYDNNEHNKRELYALTGKIMKYIDKGMPLEKIRKKTGAEPDFIEDVARMYLTHQNVGVQGILDRIEIKGR